MDMVAEHDMKALGFQSVVHMFDVMEHPAQYDADLRLKVECLSQFNRRMYPQQRNETNCRPSLSSDSNADGSKHSRSSINRDRYTTGAQRVISREKPVVFYRARRVMTETVPGRERPIWSGAGSSITLVKLTSRHRNALVNSRKRKIVEARRRFS